MSAGVDHPEHYRPGTYEAIAVIEAWGLGFHLGNVVKYVCRAGRKDGVDVLTDLRKAAWYLAREVERLERAAECERVALTARRMLTPTPDGRGE